MAWKHNSAYDTPEYRAARRRVLAAAKGCALNYSGVCTGSPTEADHVRGIAEDPEHKHLQAVCGPCHDVKSSAERRAALAGKRVDWSPECSSGDRLVNGELVHPDDGRGGTLIHPSRDASAIPFRRMTDW